MAQRDFGVSFGGGGALSQSKQNADRRERLRKLALETVNLKEDPYFMKNHLGYYECKLCLTTHHNEGNYLAHTQGKRHQYNLKKRQAKLERYQSKSVVENSLIEELQTHQEDKKKNSIKIGKPGYQVGKLYDPQTIQKTLMFNIFYPEIQVGMQPLFRFVSAFEQKIDIPPDKNYQYLIFAAEPYENIAFKIPNLPIDKQPGKFETQWDREKLIFSLTLRFIDTKVNSNDHNQ